MSRVNNPMLQIIDANLNRTREGMRVCEDISRFILSDKFISRSLKNIRHAATKALLHSEKLSLKKLVQTRDIKNDALKFVDFNKHKGSDVSDVFMSNIERVKESLRVLEECCKIIDKTASRKYRSLRFNAYSIEKRAIEKIRAIPCNR
ncbi:MAG: thiamine-phosphate pyrophosphorylase [Candidatus Omnitrophota bacterium]|jgi:thiamine-phosphate pyrophosphorylase|nr:thiamine-phosphate pyrophosphorylase [Candidatus Omnitrophota bacterium]